MRSLYLRNLFFTLLQPGIVAGLIPFLILGNRVQTVLQGCWRIPQYAGLMIFLAGMIILFHCILRFANEGQGTLSPADPTKKLVIRGLYRHSRNPMYIGVLFLLAGEAMLFQSVNVWIYMLCVFIVFHTYIIFKEEPRLKKDFGNTYTAYCSRVRRWL